MKLPSNIPVDSDIKQARSFDNYPFLISNRNLQVALWIWFIPVYVSGVTSTESNKILTHPVHLKIWSVLLNLSEQNSKLNHY